MKKSTLKIENKKYGKHIKMKGGMDVTKVAV